MTEDKTCTKCGATKPACEFNKDLQKRDGLTSACTTCRRAYGKAWHAKAGVERRVRNCRAITKSRKEYYGANRERFKEYGRAWVEKNKDKHRESTRAAMRRRRATPKGRLENNVSRALHRCLKGIGGKAGRATFDILGYSVDDLRRHLESKFQSGMTWENYGPVWHVDHRIPLAVHNYSSVDHIDFKRAWALSNLQPLWARDNISKGARLDERFQPSLAIGDTK